jgi:hypothetical protein
MVNPNYIVQQMKELDYKFYVVEDMAGNSVTHNWQTLTIDKAVERFKNFLENCAVGSSFVVYLYQTNDRNKSNGLPSTRNIPLRFECYINEPYAKKSIADNSDRNLGINGMDLNPTGIAESMYRAGAMGSIGLDTFIGAKDEILALKLKIQQLEMENRYLSDKHESEIRRLTKEYEDKLTSDKKIEGIIGSVLPAMGFGGSGIAGFGTASVDNTINNTNTMEKETSKEKVIKAINVLLEKDANFVENITKLAELSKKNPAVYQIAVKHLNSLS